MFVVTHAIAGWLIAERTCYHRRDLGLVTASAIAPDFDSLAVLFDPLYYQAIHQQLTHGLPTAILVALFAHRFAIDKRKTVCWVLVAFHVHLLLDLLSATTLSTAWQSMHIAYLAPLPDVWTWSWHGQWTLLCWQNVALFFAIVIYAVHRCIVTGCTPIYLFSKHWDYLLVKNLRYRQRPQYSLWNKPWLPDSRRRS